MEIAEGGGRIIAIVGEGVGEQGVMWGVGHSAGKRMKLISNNNQLLSLGIRTITMYRRIKIDLLGLLIVFTCNF